MILIRPTYVLMQLVCDFLILQIQFQHIVLQTLPVSLQQQK